MYALQLKLDPWGKLFVKFFLGVGLKNQVAMKLVKKH